MASSVTQTSQSVNGVDVAGLKQTIDSVRQDPSLGRFQFRARNQWLGAAHNQTTIKDFYGAGKEDDTRRQAYVFDCDEPPVLLGQDQGANPVEHLLNALAGCLTTALVMHAAARGIEVESVSSELEGDIDVRGFLGLTDQVPRGFQRIRVAMHVKSDAPAEKLAELARYSPVFNTIINPTPVEVQIVKEP